MITTSTNTQHSNGSPKMTRRNSKTYMIARPQSKNSLLKYTKSSGNLYSSRSRSSSFSSAGKLVAAINNAPQRHGFTSSQSPLIGRTVIPPGHVPKRSDSPSFYLGKSASVCTNSDESSPANSLGGGTTSDNSARGTKEESGSTKYDDRKMKKFLDEVERRLDGSINGDPLPQKRPCRSVHMDIPSATNSIRSEITMDGGNALDYQEDTLSKLPNGKTQLNLIKSESHGEEDSEGDEEDDVHICIPVPSFVNRIIRRKRKREKDIFEEAARQMKLEKDSLEYENSQPCEVEKCNEPIVPTQKHGILRLLDIGVGDIGLALFIPINWSAFEPLKTDQKDGNKTEDNTGNDDGPEDDSDSEASDESFSDDDVMIALEDEIASYPPILTRRQMSEMSKVLPPSVSLMTWNRAYSLSRDGDFFQTMVRKCANFQHTVIVIKTDQGDILGGYADTPWGPVKGANATKSRNFFGGGRAFLYTTNPCLTEGEMTEELRYRNPKDTIFFYRWTGENNYSQICNLERGTMGMGGGGAFGFYVQQDFTTGSSGSCFTFRNPPLTKAEGGHFRIVDFEVYGFSSMAKSFSSLSMRSRTSSVSSFNYMGSTASVCSILE